MAKTKPKKRKRSLGKTIGIIVLVLFVLGLIGKLNESERKAAVLEQEVKMLEDMQRVDTNVEPEGSVKVVLTEAELNRRFAEDIARKQQGNNYVTDMRVSLGQDNGTLSMAWLKGLTLTATIIVSLDGTGLEVTDVEAKGAGLLNTAFENVAREFLNNLLAAVSNAQGSRLVQLDLEPGELVAYYALR